MSKIYKYICDCCGKIRKKDIFGVEREYLQSGKIQSIQAPNNNLSVFGVDLCKDCAHKIDMEIMQMKVNILEGKI